VHKIKTINNDRTSKISEMPWITLLAYCTIAAVHATHASSSPASCPNPAIVECALRAAGVREPATMLTSLLRAELRTVGDISELDPSEAAELFEELRAAAVPLGDRSRLRKVALGAGDPAVILPGGVLSAELTKETRATGRRQLQASGGFSIEVAAIVVTGLMGMVGYLVQARSAQTAAEAQAGIDQGSTPFTTKKFSPPRWRYKNIITL
jgi:hypothetical protein